MKIKDLLKTYSNILSENGFESPYLDVELLLSNVSGLSRIDFISKSDDEISNVVLKKFEKLFKRRLKHEPIAYILGYKNFCGFDFKVNKDVLIPRPLTESLVDFIFTEIDCQKSNLKNQNNKINFIEIGTGSGCIVISILKKILNSCTECNFNFFASDISRKALKVARNNAKYFCVDNKINFLKGDLRFPNIKFDIIVANLPYVDFNTVDFNNDNQKDLAFEPKMALFHKDKGFYLVRKLLKKIIKKNLLNINGVVFLEIEKGQSQRIKYEFGNYFNVEEFFDGRIVKLIRQDKNK